MKYTLIKNGNVIFPDVVKKADILICDGKIADENFKGELPESCEVFDACENFVSPGFIDIHLHGGGGYDYMDATEEAFLEISKTHLENGSTTIVPTLVSSDFSDMLTTAKLIEKTKPLCKNVFGVHLEGPFISPNQKGAHKEKHLRIPTDEHAELILSAGKGVIRRITAAPELFGMQEFARKMVDSGISMSVGHSDATSDITLSAFDYGFSHVTHLYSATPSVRKINQVVMAGVIEAAYLDDRATVELIADGKHAAVDALRLAVKIKGEDKVALVSDALRPAGTDVKESYLGEKIPENRVIIEDGVAKLPDRSSFAGSIATCSRLLERGVNHYGFSLLSTVKMLTKTPARILGCSDIGEIASGKAADIVIFNNEFTIENVFLKGEKVR